MTRARDVPPRGLLVLRAMPRHLFVKIRPFAQKLRSTRLFRLLGPKIADPRLWSLNRRAITIAFGTGIGISFMPLPVHLPLGLVLAMLWHLNVPTLVVTSAIVNPVTAVPIYYFAYRVGALLLGVEPGGFTFELSWAWLQHGLGVIWKPFLLGCLVCGTIGGYGAYRLLEVMWRISTMNRKSARRSAAAQKRYPPI
jgi:uncharacterized protein (DUF2062 family)